PQVVDGGGVDLADDHAVRLTRVKGAVAHPPAHRVDLLDDLDHAELPSSVRPALPRASSVASGSRCGAQKRRNGSSHAATSRSGSGLTAYSRRVPAARTVAKPLSRSTLRCCDTAGWEMPNSARMTAHTPPEVTSPSAISSRTRRRTGSPSTSKACIAPELQSLLI